MASHNANRGLDHVQFGSTNFHLHSSVDWAEEPEIVTDASGRSKQLPPTWFTRHESMQRKPADGERLQFRWVLQFQCMRRGKQTLQNMEQAWAMCMRMWQAGLHLKCVLSVRSIEDCSTRPTDMPLYNVVLTG